MIEDGMPKMKPLKSRIEAILEVKPPKMQILLWYGELHVHLLTQFTREIGSHIFPYKKRNSISLGRRTAKPF